MDLVACRGIVRRSCLSAYEDINPPTPSVAKRVGKKQRSASDILVSPKRKIQSAKIPAVYSLKYLRGVPQKSNKD